MTKEKAEKLLPVFNAYAQGKQIQVYDIKYETWIDVKTIDFNLNPNLYRIKPQAKYRPFKDKDECWDEILKHQPIGWIDDKKHNRKLLITILDFLNFETEFKNCTFIDGSPFGILDEEL